MRETKNLYVGFDLCDDNSQISCFHPDTDEIVTIGGNGIDAYYFIPTLLGVTRAKKDWVFGENAKMMAQKEEGILIDHIISRILEHKPFSIYETDVEGSVVLEKFFKKTLVLLRRYYPGEKITKIVVTVRKNDPVLEEAIFTALSGLGIEKDRALVEEHTQSCLCFVMCQSPDLLRKDTALFDYGKDETCFYRFHMNTKVRPTAVTMERIDCTDKLPYSVYEDPDKRNRILTFRKAMDTILYKRDISAIYFTGDGFLSEWADASLKDICVGKRGFRGPNIYTRGALLRAKAEYTGELNQKYLVLTEEILQNAVLLKVYKDGSIIETEIVPAGIPYKEANGSIMVMFDRIEELEIILKNLMNGERSVRLIPLEGMPERKNKMGRYELSFHFLTIHTCVLTVREKGFGEFAVSTNRVWEKQIQWEN